MGEAKSNVLGKSELSQSVRPLKALGEEWSEAVPRQEKTQDTLYSIQIRTVSSIDRPLHD